MVPDHDPFYDEPADLESVAPGTVLRTRRVDVGFFGQFRRGTATQLLYRSTNVHRVAEAAVTTVLLPDGVPPERCPVLSYQCAIDAMASRCFPSYALRQGSRLVGSSVQFEHLFIDAALAQGWAVSVPDHEGRQGMWGAPYEPGFRVLDGLRAAVGCRELGLSPTPKMAIWGYSGGGLASGWAAEVAADYAPELDLVGAVLGAPVVNPESVARRLNGGFWAGLPALMIASLVHVFPEARRVVEEHATPEGKAVLAQIETMSTGAAIRHFVNADIGRYVDMTADELFDLPEVRHVFEATKLGQSVPSMPVLVIQGAHDPIVGVATVDRLVDWYRAGGATVTYHRDPLAEHLLLYPFAVPMSIAWLNERLHGSKAQARSSGWPAVLSPPTWVGVAKYAATAARAIARR